MPPKPDKVAEYIYALKASSRMADQVVTHRSFPKSRAQYGQPEAPWPEPIAHILKKADVKKLFKHQVQAIDLIRRGENIVAATPTASGKTFMYNLPVLEALAQDPGAHALYMFPLKALTQDQIKTFRKLAANMENGPTAEIYDGDTTSYRRRKIKEAPPNALFTNPEMLHLGFLPYHHNWEGFFGKLKFIIVDEVHTYRGVMGSHMAWVFARLLRVCRYYGSDPQFVMCSATIANPRDLACRLTGRNFKLVEKSTAPRGARHVVFMNPQTGPAQTAIMLLKAALARGLRTIVYTQSRKMTELISMWASERAGEFKDKISAYRAGYLPEERREIETKLASGELLAVVSTSALELGIDIGALDLCILVGYPGTVMATWQRGGRVGRDLSESAMVLIAGEDALDQYFMRNPEDFFSRSVENAVINPLNPVISARHIECAAAELPLNLDDPILQSGELDNTIYGLEQEGKLLRDAEGSRLYASKKKPQRDVDLRGSGSQFTIMVADPEDPEGPGGQSVGQIDLFRAFRETHPGAIYLHLGRTYRVDALDLARRTVYARPAHVDYYTQARGDKDTEILEIFDEKTVWGTRVYCGRLKVTDQVTGFESKKVRTRKSLGITPLDLPSNTFETQGLWFEIPGHTQKAVEDKFMHFMGGIHAIEHAAIGIAPLIVMADRNDLGGISTPFHPQMGGPAVFIYDGVPGGVGLSLIAFKKALELFSKTMQAIKSCPCETGCPSCVHSPKCGSGNRPIDKEASLFILESIRGAKPEKRKRIVLNKPEEANKAAEQAPPPEKPAINIQSSENKGVDLGQAYAAAIDAYIQPEREHNPFKSQENYGVLDIETRRSAAEVGGWGAAYRMGVSCSVLYDSRDGKFHEYFQDDTDALAQHLTQLDLVVGFNIIRFDYQVLSAHTAFDFSQIPTLDMLQKIYGVLGYRISLDKLAQHTLGTQKTADGLQALKWWKQGKIDKILKYCRADVAITRDLFLYGREHGHLLFQNKAKKVVRVPVKW
ncbi:DEAD/DEAH box helicase [Desulfatibacillum aliphaticivorans]|uniref:DEAD/DEAH box helicase n=1 Tax=Desulfatibacillum aliphaticivorans TaxID=218208 RepID=UPI0004183D4B|nr:DEAD/DEAH box helicase [Desulfatibacillum aliphaticivorans]